MKSTGILPLQAPPPNYPHRPNKNHIWRAFAYVLLFQLAFCFFYLQRSYLGSVVPNDRIQSVVRPGVLAHRLNLTERCKTLRAPAGPPPTFDPASRLKGKSDRFVPGTRPVLIRNAKIWTGHEDGKEVVHGDVLLDRGLVVGVGKISKLDYEGLKELRVVDAKGRWVTPGLVDLHSHIGVDSSPHLSGMSNSQYIGTCKGTLLIILWTGAADTNSGKAPILPWIRSIDGINTRDQAFELTISGGVTTAQVLPGSAGNIGMWPLR